MKITTGTIGLGIAVFVWSIFMGITAISIGIGALYPPANMIAKPFVCLNGQLTYEQHVSKPLPGTTYTTTTWYCVDARSGARTQLDIFPMSLYAGVIYGLLLFVLLVIIWARVQPKDVTIAGQDRASARTAAAIRPYPKNSPVIEAPAEEGDAVARMKELNKLHAAHMISEAEYQQKRAEILREL